MLDKFRNLNATEIDCRVSMAKSNGCALLLYKDARADMTILDETVGPMNWKREHSRDNANCTVLIWDEEKQQWIGKEDTGTESNTEKEKGLASDSFKRACVNWGIGRELYTAPFIWIPSENTNIEQRADGGYAVKDSFKVSFISYDFAGNIDGLTIVNKKGKVVFHKKPTDKSYQMPLSEEEQEKVKNKIKEAGVDEGWAYARVGAKDVSDMCKEQANILWYDLEIIIDGFANQSEQSV